jgi:hypothetical protein
MTRSCAAVLLILASASPRSLAQGVDKPPPSAGGVEGGGVAGTLGTPGGTNPLVILMAPAVQTELKLTDPQKTQVFELAREAGRKSRELFQSMLQPGGVNPQALMMAGARLRHENERAAASILKPEQKERVNQILLRVEGPLAVARPEVADKLNLTPIQTQQVQATILQLMRAQRETLLATRVASANSGGIPDPGQGAQARAGMARLREAAGQQIGRILNGKQKAAFNKMLGEPFDLAKIDPELARPAASTPADGQGNDTETPRPRRKRTTAPKQPTSKDAETGDIPKP